MTSALIIHEIILLSLVGVSSNPVANSDNPQTPEEALLRINRADFSLSNIPCRRRDTEQFLIQNGINIERHDESMVAEVCTASPHHHSHDHRSCDVPEVPGCFRNDVRDVNNRGTCTWHYYVDVNETRTPSKIVKAVCDEDIVVYCKYSENGRCGATDCEIRSCETVSYYLPVVNKVAVESTGFEFRMSLEEVPVACVCAKLQRARHHNPNYYDRRVPPPL